MQLYLDDCQQCEGRGVVGDGQQAIGCPCCNAWCAFCLTEAAAQPPRRRPQRGVLVAGLLHSSDKVLFRGYVCDNHKYRLRFFSFIMPWMLDPDRWQLGTAYLVTQFDRVFVELYGLGEARNWRALEADARAALYTVRLRNPDGFYPCPPHIAERAVWPQLRE